MLVTGNIRHFAPLFRDWLVSGREHPGIIYIHPNHYKNSGLIAEELTMLHEAGSADDMKNREWWI